MKKQILTLALAAAMTTVGFAQTAAVRQTPKPEATMSKFLTSIQGVWVITSINGEEPAAGSPEITLTITGDKYAETIDGNVAERGTFKIDEAKKPMTMDLMIAEGQSAGKTQLGIVEVTENTMRGNLNEAGLTARPTNFNPAQGLFLFTAKKK